jgi:hypothetical protein
MPELIILKTVLENWLPFADLMMAVSCMFN